MAELDRSKVIVLLAKLLGMLGSSFPNEVAIAVEKIIQLGRSTELDWPTVLGPARDPQEGDLRRELEAARDACIMLLDENESLRAALTQRSDPGDFAPVGATTITIVIGDFVRAARWGLERHAAGEIGLNEFEQTFLGTCARWRNLA